MTIDVGRHSGAHIPAARFKAQVVGLMRDLHTWRGRRIVRVRMSAACQ
jgi:hypothetical protein